MSGKIKFSMPKFGKNGTTQAKPKAPKVATIAKPAAKAVAKVKAAVKPSGVRSGGAGYRKYDGDALWLPNTQRPEWLDGSMIGDRGFDPLGLSKPVEYLQVELDALDQNKNRNKAGSVLGGFSPSLDQVSTERLQPYSEVFNIQRFRECEIIHGRWAMLACLGCVVAEATTGVSWVEAGKVELDGAQYFNFSLPISITQLCYFEALAVGGAEVYRNTQLDPVQRCYPGGVFDPLNLASENSEKTDRLKEAELKHCRLAMISFLGYSVQALTTGEGAIGSLALFTKNLNN